MTGAANQSYRLAAGGLIRRNEPVEFTFDGRSYSGYAGDTLASALLANGVRLAGRSFKYHRPRGILSAGSEEPNALVELRSGARREPNTRATTAEIYQGLVATSQNRWPSLSFDLLSINGLFSPVFIAGFYYKTFMWPAAFWEKVYEPIIRRAAGLGEAAVEDDPDSYEKKTAFCDVLIAGSGPAGLTAALSAGRAGARVILAEEDFVFGGRLNSDGRKLVGANGKSWLEETLGELESLPNVRLLKRTTVFGAYDGGTYSAVERVTDHLAQAAHTPRQRLWRIVAKRSVIAAGATERPIAFGNNDRPGVMLAGAVRTYIHRFGVAPGRKAVVFANNDEGALTVESLAGAGVRVAALVDTRREASPAITAATSKHGVRLISGGAIRDVRGRQGVSGVNITTASRETIDLDCDLVAVSGGWNPNVQLTTHLGGKPQWNDTIAAFVPGMMPKGMGAAGAASGAYSLKQCLESGAHAGGVAVDAIGFKAVALDLPDAGEEATSVTAYWQVSDSKHKAFVDFQNDVTTSDIALAEREGFRAVEHLKRYTTLGMATDQGRTSGVNGLAILASITGKTIPETGMTTARPPYTPVSLGVLGGHHRGRDFKPVRLPPSHSWAKAQGARFVETGLWLRAQYYPKPHEADWFEAVSREVTAVRSGVGVCDVSTLGKIEVKGRDAAALLDRVYINMFSTLSVGKCRYGAMLREDGIVLDDGTAARFADDHYFVTTTTVNAVRVMQHLEFCRQWLWPDLDVHLSSATDQWAQYSVAGPKARELLAQIVDAPFDISNEAFPYMAAAKLTVLGGIKARLYRLSFSGELAYEIAVPARFGDGLMRKLMEIGAPLGIVPYGTEALGVMRIEKGHVGGSEINGTTTATDLGLGKMASQKKDYIGRVLAGRPGLTDPDRPRLTGFRPVDRGERLRSGAHFLAKGASATAQNDDGYMTSVAYSPSLGHWIGLGLLKRAEQRIGEIVRAYDPVRGGDTLVEVVRPVFIDTEGVRVRA